jgi:hypothetical protein
LHSIDEALNFAEDLERANRMGIVIEGIEGHHRIVEKAVAAVYSNTAASAPDSERHKGFLLLILWQLQSQLFAWSVDSFIYCLRQAHEIAATGFDQARLMLLSQCDPAYPDDFIPLQDANWSAIESIIHILRNKKNGTTKQGNELLLRLKRNGRYKSLLER